MFVEYAKEGPDDVLIRSTVHNRLETERGHVMARVIREQVRGEMTGER